MSIIEKAKQHYVVQLENPTKHHVDEWDCDIYTFPLTLRQFDKLIKMNETGGFEQMVDIIMMVAKTSSNKLAFASKDKEQLMDNVDPRVVMKVANLLSDDLMPKDNDIKNG